MKVKLKEATWLVTVAEQAHEGEVGFYCGTEQKTGRLVIVVGTDNDPVSLAEDFDLVTNDAAEAISWLCGVPLIDQLRVYLLSYGTAEAAGDLTLAYRSADVLIEAVRAWVDDCDIRLSGPGLIPDEIMADATASLEAAGFAGFDIPDH